MKTIYKLTIVSFFISINVEAQTFIQKADFPGGIRWNNISFTIGDNIYTGGGLDTSSFKLDLWEYNTSSNIWSKKADLPSKLTLETSCELNGNSYIGLAWDGTKALKDWWQYNRALDLWTKKADFPGKPRYSASSYSWNNEIYIIGGADYDTLSNSGNTFNDIWKYNPVNDNWIQLDTFPGAARQSAYSLISDKKLYIGFGGTADLGNIYSDMFSYDLEKKIWKSLASFPSLPSEPSGLVNFAGTFNNNIILIDIDWAVSAPNDYNNIYVYDINKDEWTIYKMANPSPWRVLGFGEVVGNKGYLGSGYDYEFDVWYNDTWEIDLAKVVTAVENQFPEYANIKLNATYTNIHVELPEKLWDHSQLLIQTIDGKEIKKYMLDNVTDIDLSIYPVGPYVWSIQNKGILIKSGKIIRM